MADSDFQFYLQNKDPFKSPYSKAIGDRSGGTTLALPANYKTSADLFKGVNWQNSQPRPGTLLPASFGSGTNLGTGYTGAFSYTGAAPGINPGVFKNTPGLDTLVATKNPQVQGQIDNTLGQIGSLTPGKTDYFGRSQPISDIVSGGLKEVQGMQFDPNTNSYVVRANVKDQGVKTATDAGMARYGGDVTANRTAVDQYAAGNAATSQEASGITEQEKNAIGAFYGDASDPNSVAGRLDKIARSQSIAAAGKNNRLVDALNRTLNVGRMSRGDGSWATAQASDTLGNLAAQEAVRQGDLSRANYLQVLQGQQANVGVRNRLTDELLRRGLNPVLARQQLAGQELGQLGQLSGIINGNTNYTVDSPELSMARRLGLTQQLQGIDQQNLESPEMVMARRLGLLQGVAGLDQNNNFYGVGGQFPNWRAPNVGGYPQPQNYDNVGLPTEPMRSPTVGGNRIRPDNFNDNLQQQNWDRDNFYGNATRGGSPYGVVDGNYYGDSRAVPGGGIVNGVDYGQYAGVQSPELPLWPGYPGEVPAPEPY